MLQAIAKKMNNKISPQPQPEQEQPRPKPNRSSNQSNNQPSKINSNIPARQP
jgi:hypothetical protein